ncbi:MAG: ABC transporter ATP-binding protein [Myxococcota bacterium]
MKSLRRLLRYIRPETPTLLAAYLCMIVLAVTGAFYAFLSGPAFKFISSGDIGDVLRSSIGQLRSIWPAVPTEWVTSIETMDRMEALLILPLLVVITAALKGMAQTGQFFLLGRISQRILRAVRRDAFDAMLGQSPAFYTKRSHGDLLSRLTHDANLVEQAVFYGCAPLLREPLSVLAYLVLCFVVNPKLALFTFVTVPVAIIPVAYFARRLKRVARRGQDIQGSINAVAYEALAGIRVVQANGREEGERQKLDAAAGRYYRQMLKSYFIRAVRTPTMEVLGAIAIGGLLGLLGYMVQVHQADPAHYITFFVAVVMMYDPLKKLGNVTDYLAHGAAAADRIFEIVDMTPEIRDRNSAIELPPFRDKVTFEAVQFAYDEAPVLDGVDLELPAGSLIAVVGPSGAGKTTMALLLPRFYDVTGGRLAIDGHDIRDVTLASLRRQISVVSQETFLFNASVAENIAYGKPDATPEQIRAAATAAYADGFIAELSDGYDTVIGERGVTLSGGQRQRLAIARALLRDAPLLILDEATSALDIESERYVQRALEALMQGRTSLVIAHRLSTVRRADSIAVLKEGRIVERGDHEFLMAAGGEYARLYGMQFEEPSESQPAEASPN